MSSEWATLKEAVARRGAAALYSGLCDGIIQARARRVTMFPEVDGDFSVNRLDAEADEQRRAAGLPKWVLGNFEVPSALWVVDSELIAELASSEDGTVVVGNWPANIPKPTGWPYGNAYLHQVEVKNAPYPTDDELLDEYELALKANPKLSMREFVRSTWSRIPKRSESVENVAKRFTDLRNKRRKG